MLKQTLNGVWKMKEAGTTTSYDTKVPGSVLACLLEEKAIKDPYFRKNEYEVRDLFYKDFEFSREFEADSQLLAQECLDLVCFGLDTLADVYMNDILIASVNNMHRTYRFPVKEYLRPGKNSIRIYLHSTLEYMDSINADENKEIHLIMDAMKNHQYLRKAHSMFGWDWGAQLPDAGIFRDIQIEAYSVARLTEAVITQKHEDKITVVIEKGIQVTDSAIQKIEKNPEYLLISVTLTDSATGEIVGKSRAYVDELGQVNPVSILVENPKLWWPNGFGQQPLYKLNVDLIMNDIIMDSKEYTIGLRTLTISTQKDQWGSEFAFCVNGIKIFTKGANYIPEDCVYPWITKEKVEHLIKSSVRANYNCLRVWGGGYYPSDEFYELCNQNGLIVWQDLMFACNIYDVTEEFADNIVQEAIDNAARLRHHPCLGIWCGNNEIESAWHHWANFQDHSPYLRADYIKQFEYLLPKAIKETDDQTFFWPSSPSSGGCFDDPDDENRGDNHYWDVWHGQKPFSDYRKHYFRFCSEFGFQSFPCSKTVNTFTIEEDRNIFSPVMESHQKNGVANGKILYYISENFRYPEGFDHLLYVSQVLQAVAIKSGVEHWRRNRGRCMGTLYWQINDNWPVASWSSIDYYGRWKALHYMAKNFYEPVAGSIVCEENKVEVTLQNESLKAVSGTLTLSVKNMKLEVLDSKTIPFVVDSLKAEQLYSGDYGTVLKELLEKDSKLTKSNLFVEAVFEYENGRKQVETQTFVPYKHLDLMTPKIELDVEENEDSYLLHLTTDSFAPFVELDFEETDVIFEDNYFTLSQKEKKTVCLKKEDIFRGTVASAKDLENRIKIRSLKDTY